MTVYNTHVMVNGTCQNCKATSTSSLIQQRCKCLPEPLPGTTHPSHQLDAEGRCVNCCQIEGERGIEYKCPCLD